MGGKVKRESTFDLHENGGSLFKNASEMCVTWIQFKELVAEGRNRFYGGKVGISLATASVAFGWVGVVIEICNVLSTKTTTVKQTTVDITELQYVSTRF